jgi:hypothetical protein
MVKRAGLILAFLVVLSVAIGIGFVVGQRAPSSGVVPQKGANSVLCQDALARRRQAEDALARSAGGELSSDQRRARSAAQENLRTAQQDIARYC